MKRVGRGKKSPSAMKKAKQRQPPRMKQRRRRKKTATVKQKQTAKMKQRASFVALKQRMEHMQRTVRDTPTPDAAMLSAMCAQCLEQLSQLLRDTLAREKEEKRTSEEVEVLRLELRTLMGTSSSSQRRHGREANSQGSPAPYSIVL